MNPPEDAYFVDLIIAERGRANKEYFLKWHNLDNCSWVPQPQVDNCQQLLNLHNNHQRQFRRWVSSLTDPILSDHFKWCTEQYTANSVNLGKIYETFQLYSTRKKETLRDLDLYFVYNFHLFLMWRIRGPSGQQGKAEGENNYTILQYKTLLKYSWQLARFDK